MKPDNQYLKRAITFFILWNAAFWLALPGYLNFRNTGTMMFFYRQLQGQDAIAALAILAFLSVMFFAFALWYLHRHFSQLRGE
ncbi:MAG: hypothetical protein MJA83_09460 [Gammaproteobacteria bacterium]|nr:hypothetical protein [Gammaproteobacteria bacterium]